MKVEIQLENREGKPIGYKYKFYKESCIGIVETNAVRNDENIELIASHICNSHKANPLRLILLIEVENCWNMVQFGEFYNNQTRIYKKDIVSTDDIQEFMG